MDTNKEIFTRLQNQIFSLLCKKAETALNQREIAHLLKVSPTAVAKALPVLAKEKLIILQKEKRMNLSHVRLNRESIRSLRLKRVENLKLIYESGLSDFLHENFPGATITLFGSYAFGDDTKVSDIDLAIIGSKEKDLALDAFEKMFERKINLNHYSSLKSIALNLKNSLMNGIVLEGFLEL